MSSYAPKWMALRRTLKLSQIIDMYYSNEGVSFDPTVKACNRQSLFSNTVNRTDLFTETSRFAHVLSLRQITVYIPVEEMERITNAAVTAFLDYVRKFTGGVLLNPATRYPFVRLIGRLFSYCDYPQ